MSRTAVKKLKSKTKRQLIGLAFVSVWIIGFAIFTFYPLLQTLIFSFNKVIVTTQGSVVTSFMGFDNYYRIFATDTEFIDIMVDYLLQTAVEVPIIIVISLLISMLLNSKMRGTTFMRTVFFLPVIITSGSLIRLLIDLDIASLPGAYALIDLGLLEQSVPMAVVNILRHLIDSFIMIMWYSGIQILIFLAALQKMDKNVYEAASIDGASAWERFWKITLPALNPMIILNLVFTIVTQSHFALNPIIIKIKNDMVSLGRGYGYSSAEAWTYFVLLIVVLTAAVLLVRRREKKYKPEYYKPADNY